MLKGDDGFQRKEIDKLVDWLATEVRPDIINVSNVILAGMVPRLRERLKVPVIGSLQGDDIFLEMLPAHQRGQAIDLISAYCATMEGFIATSRYYADFMSEYLRIQRDKILVVHPGINLKGHANEPRLSGSESRPFTIGYFARIAHEKGLHNLVDAFCLLKQTPGLPPCRLRVSGWLGNHNRPYFEEQKAKLARANVLGDFEHVDSPEHASKVRFLQSIDVLSVPTTYREPKGLYVLEAWANGVPVVQPAHGSFPELIESTGAGLLVPPDDPRALAEALRQMIEEPEKRQRLGQLGYQAVRDRFHAAKMARATIDVYHKFIVR
jgi:glycosyltransferase involved in cell wall biosynthesis